MILNKSPFLSVPKNSTCFQVWKLDGDNLVKLPASQFGKFYRTSAYLVLSISSDESGGGVSTCGVGIVSRPTSKRWCAIHIWLGSQFSQETAAQITCYALQLDAHVGGEVLLLREVEDRESARFCSYFSRGMYHLDDESAEVECSIGAHQPVLYLVSGRKTILLQQLTTLSWDYFSDDKIYLIDNCNIIFLWIGKTVGSARKEKSTQMAARLAEEKPNTTLFIIESGTEKNLALTRNKLLNKILPISHRDVSSRYVKISDEDSSVHHTANVTLYQCRNTGDTLNIDKLKVGGLYREDLKSDCVYIVDNGVRGVWIWIGRKAFPSHRTEAMRNVLGFCKKKAYSQLSLVGRVIESGEPGEFQCLFAGWGTNASSKSANSDQVTNPIVSMANQDTLRGGDDTRLNGGKSTIEIWRVINNNLTKISKKEHGTFYTNQCYAILYRQPICDRPPINFLLYWLGNDSCRDDGDILLIRVAEIDRNLSRSCVVSRIPQQCEPTFFLALFNGEMTIKKNEYDRPIKLQVDSGKSVSSTARLFHVEGTSIETARAIQTECRSSCLVIWACSILCTHNHTFLWYGKRATGDQRAIARAICEKRHQDVTVVYQNHETKEFWQMIDHDQPPNEVQPDSPTHDNRKPRFFYCIQDNLGWKFEVIINCHQADLTNEDIVLLDTYRSVYLWLGEKWNIIEVNRMEKIAHLYLSSWCSRKPDFSVPLYFIRQEHEPPIFTDHFNSWNTQMWKEAIGLHQKIEEINNRSANLSVSDFLASNKRSLSSSVYPADILREQNLEFLPEDVDPCRKEYHLSPEQFYALFGCKREQYQQLPKWKQLQLKKHTGLF